MDLAQLEQLVTWLDEQRRQSDQYIRQLEQRIVAQQNMLEEQAQRIQQLEGDLAALRAQLAEYGAFKQAMENLRNEVRHMIERLEEEQLARERDQERVRAAEREKIRREIDRLRKDMETVSTLAESVEGLRSEARRLNEVFLKLRESATAVDRRLEEATRDVTLLTEQRSQDHRRISQVQAEVIELFRRLEALAAKATLLDDRTQRQEKVLKALQEQVESLHKDEDEYLEGIRRAEAEREQRFKQWTAEMERMRDNLQVYQERLDRYQVQYEKASQAVASIERWQAEFKKEVHEIREAQRLTANRLHKQMREFEAEQEKRWQKQLLEWDYRWQEHQRHLQRVTEEVARVQKLIALHGQLLDILWRLEEEWGSLQLSEAQRALQLIGEVAEKREQLLKEQERVKAPVGE